MSRSATAGLTALLLLLLALPAAATSTRLLSMGGGADYLEDVDNVRRWPGTLATYPDLLLLDLGEQYYSQAVGQSLGAHLSLDAGGRYGVAGLWLYGDDPARDLGLMWGLKRGGWQLGLDTTYGAHTSYDHQAGTRNVNADWSFACGLRRELAPRTWTDLACDGTSTSDRIHIFGEEVVDDHREFDSYGLRWRLFRGLGERLAVVPCLSWERDLGYEHVIEDWFGRSFGYSSSEAFHFNHNDTRTFKGGLGMTLLPDSDRMLQASVTWFHLDSRLSDPAFGASAWMQRQRVHAAGLELRVGGEMRVLHWLTLRGGAWKTLSRCDVEIVSQHFTDSVRDVAADDMDASLGFGIHLGDFDADLALADGAPFELGGLLANTSSHSELWSRITLQVVF